MMRILKYAVRPLVILKYFGLLGFVLALMTVVPLAVSLLFGDYHVSFRYAIVIIGIFILSVGLMRLPAPKRLQTNEAMVITALIFLFAPLAMSWPMMASGLGFLDALFESISGVTTTGLTTTATVADKPETFLFARAWMQWVGGLGIVVLSLAVMIQPGLVAKRLGDMEDYEEDMIGGTRAHARIVFIVYAALTAVGIVVLGLLKIGWFEAMLYCFAAVSTGGFSPHDGSLAALGSRLAQAAVILLSMAGGISLIAYHRVFRDGWRTIVKDHQLRGFLIAGLLTTLLMAGSLWFQSGFEWPRALGHGALNALSAQSTAGFASLDTSQLDAASKLILIFSMFLGGSIGSTAGGIKILRLLILMRLLYLSIQRAGMPKNAVAEARLGGRRLEADEIQNALSLILVFIVFIVVSWLPFVVMGHNPLDSLFEVVSAIGTAGISAGITTPALHPFLKAILCVDMLLGRLEIFAWLIMVFPGTWFGKRLEE
ncbi:MAG: TrkH family potassium uptake protein [Desulfobacteraceae bacterium]|jgi:trk system potassium uptake protein TrkH